VPEACLGITARPGIAMLGIIAISVILAGGGPPLCAAPRLELRNCFKFISANLKAASDTYGPISTETVSVASNRAEGAEYTFGKN
jgi:hypothetical protein